MSELDDIQAAGEMEQACEIQRYADKEIDCMISAFDGDISKLEAAKLIIEDQAEQIKAKDAEIEQAIAKINDAWTTISDDILEDQVLDDGNFGPYANAAAMAMADLQTAERLLKSGAYYGETQ